MTALPDGSVAIAAAQLGDLNGIFLFRWTIAPGVSSAAPTSSSTPRSTRPCRIAPERRSRHVHRGPDAVRWRPVTAGRSIAACASTTTGRGGPAPRGRATGSASSTPGRHERRRRRGDRRRRRGHRGQPAHVDPGDRPARARPEDFGVDGLATFTGGGGCRRVRGCLRATMTCSSPATSTRRESRGVSCCATKRTDASTPTSVATGPVHRPRQAGRGPLRPRRPRSDRRLRSGRSSSSARTSTATTASSAS